MHRNGTMILVEADGNGVIQDWWYAFSFNTQVTHLSLNLPIKY